MVVTIGESQQARPANRQRMPKHPGSPQSPVVDNGIHAPDGAPCNSTRLLERRRPVHVKILHLDNLAQARHSWRTRLKTDVARQLEFADGMAGLL